MKKKESNLKVNFILQFLYQVLTMILPLATAPYIARVLGADNVGIYSYSFTVTNYFVIFSMLGLNNHGSRAIAKVKDDQQQLNIVFSSLFALHLIITGIVTVGYAAYILLFAPKYTLYLIINTIYLIAAFLDINWAFFGLEKFKITVTRNTIVKLITIACVFIFVRDKNDLWKYVFIMALGTLVSQSVVWMFLKKYIRFCKPDKKLMLENVKPMFALFVAVLATSIFRTIDKIMLGNLSVMSDVGCYENADKMIMFPVALINALGTVMLPRMAHIYANRKNEEAAKYLVSSMEFSTTMAAALSFGLAAVSHIFSIIFFGEEFALTGQILEGLGITVWLMAFNAVIRMQYIIPKGKDKIYIQAVCGAAVLNVIINALLIPTLGAMGAVIGTIVSYVFIFLYQTWCIRKELPVRKFLLNALPSALIGAVMFVAVRLLNIVIKESVSGLLIEIAFGAAVFIILFTVYVMVSKKSVFYTYLKKILRR